MWEILGIAPTNDIRAIKAAYAKLAKKNNPEENPEEFRRIYDAYKAACEFAKHHKDVPEDELAESWALSGRFERYENIVVIDHAKISKMKARIDERKRAAERTEEYDFGSVDTVAEHNTYPEFLKDKFLRTIGMIVNSESDRNSISAWRWLFEKDDFGYVADDPDFRAKVMKLIGNETFLPETASYIAEKFSHGSKAVPSKVSKANWKVYISDGGKRSQHRGNRYSSGMEKSYDDTLFVRKNMRSDVRRCFAFILALIFIGYLMLYLRAI